MSFETILVEQKGAVTLITLNRPKALNALNAQVLADLIAAFAAFEADATQRCAVMTGSGDKPLPPGPTSRKWPTNRRPISMRRISLPLDQPCGQGHAQAVDRGGQRLCAGRRVRTGDDGRFHHRGRHGQIRPARNQAGRGAGHGRIAAADPRGGQGQGDGHVPDGPDDGRGRGRAQRSPAWCRWPICWTRR
jgi:hypothetical protein